MRIFVPAVFLFVYLPMAFILADGAENRGLVLGGRVMMDNYLNQYYDTNSNQASFAYSGKTTVRLNIVNADRSQAKVQSDLDISLLYGELADNYNKYTMNTNAGLSLSGTGLTALISLRQLYIGLYPSFADVTIGRQIVNFGVGMMFSPINVFSSFDPTDVDLTRTGSDSARVKFPIGELGGLDLISTFSTTMTNTSTAVKLYGNFLGFDLSGVALYRGLYREMTAGVTFKGDLEVGVHGEFVEHFSVDTNTRYFEGMLGIDYSFFDSKLALFLEYYFNELPVDPSKVTLANIASVNRIFYNKHYLFFEALWSLDEIRKISAFVIYNPLDNALEAVAQYSQNIFQNANLAAYVQYFLNNLNGLNFIKTPEVVYALRLEVLF